MYIEQSLSSDRLTLPREGAITSPRIGGFGSQIFAISYVAVFLIFTVSSPFLDLFVNYTISGGSPIEKFHPATYVCVLFLFPLVLADAIKRGSRLDRQLLCFTILFAFIAVFLAIQNEWAPMSAVVDVEVVPIILLLALSRLSTDRIRTICRLFVWIAFANAGMVMVDFVRGAYTFPVVQSLMKDSFFRPAGFAGHPIPAAMLSVYAMYLVLKGVVHSSFRRPLMLFFLFSILLCKERTPLMIGGAIAVVNLVRPFMPRISKREYLIDAVTAIAIPGLFVIAYFSGAFDRMLALGMWDGSSQSRFKIFDVLSYLSAGQLMSGGISSSMIPLMASQTTNSSHVESFFISAVFAAGLPFAIFFALSLIAFYWRFMRKSFIFAGLVLVAFATSADFMIKGMQPAALCLIGYYLWRRDTEMPHVAKNRRRLRLFGKSKRRKLALTAA